MPISNPSHYLCFWPIDCKPEVPINLFSGSIDLLEWLPELRKLVYLLDYWFIAKEIKGYKWTAWWRDPWGEVPNTGASVQWSLVPRTCMRFWFINMEALWICFWWRLHYIGMIDQVVGYWPWLKALVHSLPRGGTEINQVDSPGNQLPSLGTSQNSPH